MSVLLSLADIIFLRVTEYYTEYQHCLWPCRILVWHSGKRFHKYFSSNAPIQWSLQSRVTQYSRKSGIMLQVASHRRDKYLDFLFSVGLAHWPYISRRLLTSVSYTGGTSVYYKYGLPFRIARHKINEANDICRATLHKLLVKMLSE